MKVDLITKNKVQRMIDDSLRKKFSEIDNKMNELNKRIMREIEWKLKK